MSEQDPNITEGTEGQAPPPTEKPADKTPEWYETELKKTRAESANYRTQLRAEQAKNAPPAPPADLETKFKELEAKLVKQERDLLVAKVGKDLPEELATLLKGNTEEELTAHAEVLRKFATPATGAKEPKPPAKLGGGLDANAGTDDTGDIATYAHKARMGLL